MIINNVARKNQEGNGCGLFAKLFPFAWKMRKTIQKFCKNSMFLNHGLYWLSPEFTVYLLAVSITQII